jgi:hypothetical protein
MRVCSALHAFLWICSYGFPRGTCTTWVSLCECRLACISVLLFDFVILCMCGVSVCEWSLACASARRFAHSFGFAVTDFRAVLVRLGLVCASGVLHVRSRCCLMFV